MAVISTSNSKRQHWASWIQSKHSPCQSWKDSVVFHKDWPRQT